MQITIKNPNDLPVVDYRTVKALQGNLKDLNEREYVKLKSVLAKRGFEIPLFLWHSPTDSIFYMLDGHQRQRLMTKEDANDNGNYNVPYLLIEAANIQEAKAKLLEITSQYGKMTQAGFDEFIAEAELIEAEVVELVAFDALPMLNYKHVEDEEEDEEEPERISMPSISFKFNNSDDRDACLAELTDLNLTDKYDAKMKVA